jgi:Tfp pilus assembly protein PilX
MLSTNKIKDVLNTKRQNGFSLVIALLAILILMALGFLAISVTTSDLQITTRIVGEKKALVAAEAGIQLLTQNFSPANIMSTSGQVDLMDSTSTYSVTAPINVNSGPAYLPIKGYAIGGGQQWGQRLYNASVTGQNTNYGSMVQIDVGIGYGPVEMTTMSR